jgi:hypothetical protein
MDMVGENKITQELVTVVRLDPNPHNLLASPLVYIYSLAFLRLSGRAP